MYNQIICIFMKLIKHDKNRYNKGDSYQITCTWAVYEHRTLKVVSSECYDNGRSPSSLIYQTYLIFTFININENCKLEKKGISAK